MTPVLIRRFRKSLGGDLIAFFPTIPADHRGNVLSYQHLGQHGAATYPHSQTVPVSKDDPAARELFAELQAIGYDDLQWARRAPRRGA